VTGTARKASWMYSYWNRSCHRRVCQFAAGTGIGERTTPDECRDRGDGRGACFNGLYRELLPL